MIPTAKLSLPTLRNILGSATFAGVLTVLILARTSSAQSAAVPVATASDPVDNAQPVPQNEPTIDDTLSYGLSDDQLTERDEKKEEDDLPSDTDLVTLLPLKTLLTPFHYGRFALLSVTAYEGYNSNPQFQRLPFGAAITSISTLALYSVQFAGWRANLQYQPFVWFSSRATLKDFAAASFDIRTLRHINGNWHWTLGDRIRYSPTHSTEESKGFVVDPEGGFSIGNAFLSSGRNVLVNGLAATLTDRYGENSTLMFHADQNYTRLSSFVSSDANVITLVPTVSIPAQQAITVSTGATWRDRISLKDTFNAEYNYRMLASSGTSVADVNSHAASVGLSHKFTTTFGGSVSIGPAWSFYGGRESTNRPSRGRTTLHGSLALSKEFRRGGVVASFARSDSFTGIISDSFHNRYDLTLHREFGTRLRCSVTGSYIQQQFSSARDTDGELFTAEARYFLNRNWALFMQARYLDISGNERILGPEKSVILGFRWFWVPEKP